MTKHVGTKFCHRNMAVKLGCGRSFCCEKLPKDVSLTEDFCDSASLWWLYPVLNAPGSSFIPSNLTLSWHFCVKASCFPFLPHLKFIAEGKVQCSIASFIYPDSTVFGISGVIQKVLTFCIFRFCTIQCWGMSSHSRHFFQLIRFPKRE